jgi:hypothetical protein
MRRFFATAMLIGIVFVFAGQAGTGAIYTPQSNRCHDKDGYFVPGPNCDIANCGCLFHEVYEFIKGMF